MKTTQAGEKDAKILHAAGERVLARVREEKNKLQDSNTKLGEELKDVRAQLADSVKENKGCEAAYSVRGQIDFTTVWR